MSDNNDVEDDYKFARDHYYKLAEKGEEAIELMLELARDSEHPRAFEVLSTMLKQNAEVADRLMELQKKTKEVKKDDNNPLSLTNGSAALTQNNVFVGSTSDLQRMLLDKMKTVDVIEE
jgi:hypothetical protein|tara:strand:+ start:272 stop:628 length:357 start_codon:yes stop_codon:yes gene_type:complete